MKKNILFIVFICLNLTCLKAQTNCSQELFELLMQDDYFDACSYYKAYKTQITGDGELFYRYRKCYLLNEPDSAAIYLNKLIDTYSDSFYGCTKIHLCNLLVSLYMENGDYRNLADAYARVREIVQMPPFCNDTIWKDNQLALLAEFEADARRRENSPRICVSRCGNQKGTVKLHQGAFISTVAKYNGIELRTIFDTGSTFPVFISKKYADKCKFREIPLPVDSIPINNSMVRAGFAVVDSITVGSILISNAVALVLHDDLLSLLPDSVPLDENQEMQYKTVVDSFDVVIGLPLLKLFGKIQINFPRREVAFLLREEVPEDDGEADFYISQKRLFAALSINDVDFVGFVDTGDCHTCISLFYDFYTKNSTGITLSEKMNELGVARIMDINPNSRFKAVINPVIKYRNNKKNFLWKNSDDCIVWFDKQNSEEEQRDGRIGLPFFKRIGDKISIDFVNMTIENEK